MRASQVSGPSSSCVPQSKTPPCAVPFSPLTQWAAEAFRRSNTLGIRDGITFEAAWPAAHTLVYLRIAAPVAGHAARLTTGLGGLTPDRAGFTPAGRRTGFHEVIAFFNPP